MILELKHTNKIELKVLSTVKKILEYFSRQNVTSWMSKSNGTIDRVKFLNLSIDHLFKIGTPTIVSVFICKKV